METEIKFDCAGVDWKKVADTLERVGMAFYEPDLHQKAFENSFVSVFAYQKNQLIGFGRAVSDGAYQAAIYDVAVQPEFQKLGLGTTIVNQILQQLPDCNIILYASPGKETFYKKFAFRKMKTGMARFMQPENMKQKKFTE